MAEGIAYEPLPRRSDGARRRYRGRSGGTIRLGATVTFPRLAHGRALEHRNHRGRDERLKNPVLREYVVSHLKLGWSPEQIAATAKEAVGISISHEAIYQFIYARVSRASKLIYGHQEDLRPYLARHRRRRMKKGMRKSYRIEKGPLPSIESRPREVEERIYVGHWEDDSIVYSPSSRAACNDDRTEESAWSSSTRHTTARWRKRTGSRRNAS